MDKNTQQSQQTNKGFLKWVILISFSVVYFVNSILGMMLVPIWDVLAYYYGVTSSEMNWVTIWIYICTLLLSRFWNILILKNFGISIIISAIFTTVGIWMAWIAETNLIMTIFGYVFIGLGNSLQCQVPLYLSKIWFDPDERIISTFLAQYTQNAGNIFGYVFVSMYFYGLEDWDQITWCISQLYYIMSIFSTVSIPVSFITLIKPKDLDSLGSSRDKLWSSYKKVYMSWESILDLASAGSIFSFCWIYPSLLAIQQYILQEDVMDIFINGVTFQAVAIVVALFCSIRLDKQSKKGLQQNYDSYIRFLIIIGCLSLVFELIFLEYLHPKFLSVINCLIGGGLNGIYSILLESLMEKHFPVQELVVGTVIQEIACVIAVIFTFLLNLEPFLLINFQVACFFLIPAFCYFIVFYETKFNRFESEA